MADTPPWRWRPFSEVCAQKAYSRFERGEKATVLHIGTGLGKTATMVRIHKEFNERTGRQFRALIYAPRLTLTGQIKKAFMTQAEVGSDGLPRRLNIGNVRDHGQHTNEPPFIPPTAFVVISTYQALQRDKIGVQAQSWRAYNDNFILYLDEAGLLSSELDDDASHVTQVVERLAEAARYAAHVVLLTGTPQRHDGGRLPFAVYEPTAHPKRHRLVADETFLYGYGAKAPADPPYFGPYLRHFDYHLKDAEQVWEKGRNEPLAADEALDPSELEIYNTWLSEGERRISALLDRRPYVEDLIEIGAQNLQRLRDRAKGKENNPNADRLAMLITCKNKTHLKCVQLWMAERFPHLRVAFAYSDLGAESQATLDEFRDQADPKKPAKYDVLLTVRQAFIGYDAPHIAVVVVLTNYRDRSHLTQIIGRGLRIWKPIPPKRQWCYIVGPDDPVLRKLCKEFREDSLKAEAWEHEEGPGPPERTPDRLVDHTGGDTIAFTEAGEMSWHELVAARTAMAEAGVDGTEADFLRAMRAYGEYVRNPTPPPPSTVEDVVDETVLCDRLRQEYATKQKQAAGRLMAKEGIGDPNGHWKQYNKLVFQWVNRVDGLGTVEKIGKNPDALRRRIGSVDDLLGRLG